MAVGNFILKIGNKSMEGLPHQTVADEIMSIGGSSVTLELNIAMRANLNTNELYG